MKIKINDKATKSVLEALKLRGDNISLYAYTLIKSFENKLLNSKL